MSGILEADVFVSIPIQTTFNSPDPIKNLWPPISSTLIQGTKSAVLVDTPISVEQTNALADWIERTAPGKTLTHIFITHAHTDHFAGAPVLLKRFPGAKLVATQAVARGIETTELEPKRFAYWNTLFPNGQLAQEQVVPDALPSPSSSLLLDGHTLQAVDVKHSDTDATSFLYVPSLRLVVCGDIVYGDCHQYLGIANTPEKRQQWIDALDTISALGPAIVVPGHKRPSQLDGPYLIEATKAYIRVFEEELAKAGNADELEAAMVRRYPTRANKYVLDRGCKIAFAV